MQSPLAVVQAFQRKRLSAKQKRRAAHNEQFLAAQLGASRTGRSAPFDLIAGRAGIEVKTLIGQGNSKVTMHPSSRRRKLREGRRLNLRPHTIAVDERGGAPVYYYAPGVKSFRLRNMRQMESLAALKKTIRAAAAPPTGI